ncbi:cryptochrome/photolyase family protein [Methanoculleus sp. FWC-SCC1]|uniref:Cryptochrome/photolyase family protein n=1 Tax=Methanoculleus frigidifontis TaxID=2584085 RepID=A0ABT8M605_9EURY|nr:cryptochrome/photolyase family protein [Methanoculleus sp. FWC-SCC1]MDN7023366.1 cryptochrome/photolyase family protein [Methanoculleus sp. FWC-SCC1]
MKDQAAIVFPHQLFREHPALTEEANVYLVEDDRFFSDFRYHKKKLLLHSASMQAYREYLEEQGHTIHFIRNQHGQTQTDLIHALAARSANTITIADPCDRTLEERLTGALRRRGIDLTIRDSPGFLTDRDFIDTFFGQSDRYSLTAFYREQRRRFGILIEDGKPIGGRWSFDPANRKPLPDEVPVPPLPRIPETRYVRDARSVIEERYPGNPGDLDEFWFPVTHRDAERWLADFLGDRLALFGDYEDAMRADEPVLFHSVLSPLLNTGLLTPRQVVDRTLAYAREHPVPINSLEGFIRQIIGWREFIRAVYIREGDRQRSSNVFGQPHPVPRSLYTASTGVVPVDRVVQRVLKSAYAHHIERLMVLGNFMLLAGIHPDEAYRWFMEVFIDAYDWAMVPNVYGMSQYADGGLMATKPYISGSHYIRRMSNYPGGEWEEIWDGLFWKFIETHQEQIAANPRMRVLLGTLNRMEKETRDAHAGVADAYLSRLHENGRAGTGRVAADSLVPMPKRGHRDY